MFASHLPIERDGFTPQYPDLDEEAEFSGGEEVFGKFSFVVSPWYFIAAVSYACAASSLVGNDPR